MPPWQMPADIAVAFLDAKAEYELVAVALRIERAGQRQKMFAGARREAR
jgi:hypothetical protein